LRLVAIRPFRKSKNSHTRATVGGGSNAADSSPICREALNSLSPNDFTDTDAITQRLADFETRYNQSAKAFKWKFTTTDLHDFLQRLDRHTDHPTAAGDCRSW